MPKLAHQCLGEERKPAVMLLHGFMSCNAQWMPNVDALLTHYRLVLVELWGHGQSPLPQQSLFFTPQAYIEQFEQIRSELGIAHWSLIGQSYGAGLMIHYALALPELCTKVVVTNSRSALGTIQPAKSRRHDPLAQPEVDLRTLPYHPIHARRFPSDIKQALVDQADQMQLAAITLGGQLGGQLSCIDLLGDLQMPLLVANGQYEKPFQSDLQQLRQRYPSLNVVNLPGGHSVNIEAADEFNDAVLAFLQDA